MEAPNWRQNRIPRNRPSLYRPEPSRLGLLCRRLYCAARRAWLHARIVRLGAKAAVVVHDLKLHQEDAEADLLKFTQSPVLQSRITEDQQQLAAIGNKIAAAQRQLALLELRA